MTETIARRFACACPDMPADVSAVADRAMLDTLGAMIAGGAHAATGAIATALPSHPGMSTRATGGTSDAETAALVNGMAAHVWDIDDTSYTGIMHGSAVVLPAVLAVAQEIGTSEDAVRRAFVVGSEITYVLADICTHSHYFHGWWSTATFSLTGATAAIGILLELNEDQMTSAMGLAAAGSGGGKAVFGTDGKPFFVGETARRAIGFARAARAGLTGPERAFEDDRGYLKLLNGGKTDMAALDTLGQRWRLVDPGLLFKTNPVCSAAHAAIDQMNALMRELEATPDQIAEIRAEVPELVYVSLVYPDPQTPQEAQFSLPYALACAALHGRVRFEDLLPDAIQDPQKMELMRKIRVESVPDLSTDDMRAKFPESARLKVTLKDGYSQQGFCGVAYGMPQNPLNDKTLIAKFHAALRFADRDGPANVAPGENILRLFGTFASDVRQVHSEAGT